jgi:cytoskeletal protein CcmA (bactofilin family)
MWTNKQASYPPGTSPGTGVGTLEPAPAPTPVTAPVSVPITMPTRNALETPRTHGSATRAPAWLGPGLKIRGQISGAEDLHVECNVEGPISLGDHRLTVGQHAHVNGEITASEVVVFGDVRGHLLASDRIEIKKHGSVVGDLTTARISIEDGAHYKGSIEIARKAQSGPDLGSLLARPEKKSL